MAALRTEDRDLWLSMYMDGELDVGQNREVEELLRTDIRWKEECELLLNLREDYRKIVVLKHLQKLSYSEIAERLNLTVTVVGEKLSRIRGLLKRRMANEFVMGTAKGEQTE